MALDAIPAPSPPLIEPLDEAVPMVTSVDCATGVVTVRPMTKAELDDKATREAEYATAQQAKATAESQRADDLVTLTKAAEGDQNLAALLRVLKLQ